MKILKKLFAAMLVIAMMLSAVACGGGSGDITVVITDGATTEEYEVELDKVELTNGLFSVLDYLKEEESLSYKESGGMITELGHLKNDGAAGKYIYIWTSVEKDHDVSEWASTKEYEGKTLTSSGVGAKDMSFEDGAVIYISYIVYG